MSDPDEKLESTAPSTKGAARATLVHLQQRYGPLTKRRQLAPGDRVLLEPMEGVEVWRVVSITDEKTWLELEDPMTQLRLIQGEGKPERPCSRCGEKWEGTDDKQHGAHRRQAQCKHIAVFNCQMEQIGSYCDCPPSGPAYPRQPHEARYEMDTAGNLRKVEGPPPDAPASPATTAPAPSPQQEVVATFPEPVDHREEVGGFGRGDPCTFQHRFNKDGACSTCGTKVPEGCTCAPSGTAATGYVHAPSCQLQPQPAPKKKMLIVDVGEGETEDAARDRAKTASLEEIITATADQAAKLIAPTDGTPPQDPGAVLAAAREVVEQAVGQALDQAGIPREAMAGPAPGDAGEDRLAWVTVDGHGLGCARCGLWEPIPKEPGALATAVAKFEGEHLFCPEKQG